MANHAVRLLFLLTLSLSFSSHAQKTSAWWQPDAVSAYAGAGTEAKLRTALVFKYDSAEETLYTLTADWKLEDSNWLQRGAQAIGADFEPVALLGHRDDRIQDISITEAAFFGNLKWTSDLWTDSVDFSLAIGWGVSYTSDITFNEVQDIKKVKDPDEGPQRWLNYLGFEYGMRFKNNPQWEYFYRLHHRSGAWGLFASTHVGSNDMGLGVRYHFE